MNYGAIAGGGEVGSETGCSETRFFPALPCLQTQMGGRDDEGIDWLYLCKHLKSTRTPNRFIVTC